MVLLCKLDLVEEQVLTLIFITENGCIGIITSLPEEKYIFF